MKSIASKRGSVDLLLVVPIMILLAWGGAILILLGRRSGDLERGAWLFETAVSHGKSEHESRTLPHAVTANIPSAAWSFVPQSRELFDLALLTRYQQRPMPTSYSGYLAFHPRRLTSLCLSDRLANWLVESRRSCDNGPGAYFARSTTAQSPGSDFRRDQILKQLLWTEAMQTSGLGYVSLSMTAIPELTRIARAAGGVGSFFPASTRELLLQEAR